MIPVNKNKNFGFTLIELTIYISITSVLLVLISSFLQTGYQARIKNKTITEVEQQGVQIVNIITQKIINSQAINSPTIGTNSSLVSLDVVDLSKDPTFFDLSSGKIRITEGVALPIDLNSSLVEASDLIFYNLSKTGTEGSLGFKFTLSFINNANRPEYNWQKTFYGAASLR